MTWPGQWISGAQKRAIEHAGNADTFVNDNGIRCLFGNTSDECFFMENVPAELEVKQ